MSRKDKCMVLRRGLELATDHIEYMMLNNQINEHEAKFMLQDAISNYNERLALVS